MESLPPLTSLLAFEALYRTGSVTEAAGRLGRTHGAVSKQLHSLQDHTGTVLFVKQGSGIELTSQGRAFARIVASALDDMRAGWSELSTDNANQPVRILASATFARSWLIPVIARFNAEHRSIDVSIRLVGPNGSLDHEGRADMTFSYNRIFSPGHWHGAVSLGDVEMGPVLAPGYPYTHSGDVLSVQTRIDRYGNESDWENWSRLSGVGVQARKEQVFDHSYLTFQAARNGMGIAMAARFLVSGMIETGELVAPLGFVRFEGGLLVRPLWRQDQRPNPDALVLLDWLKANASP